MLFRSQNLDIAIISQYNNEENIQEHGIEWTKEGLKRIKALNAERILELGTGGGHLLFQLAPNIEKYIATDYSEVAINKLNEKLALNPKKWEHVKAYKAPADDFSNIPEKDFDLVFFHGVIQYFPTLDYLVKVLEPSIKAVKDGGCIHIGDSQTLSAISMHFANDQLKLTSDSISLGEFKKIVDYRVRKEEEISIDPGFFYFLPNLLPEITGVDVQIRGGDLSNEGTKCHYDIWLYKGLNSPKIAPTDISESWQKNSSLEWIEETLTNNTEKVIQIKSIPNSRVFIDHELSQLMNQLNDNVSVKELKQRLNQIETSGVNPTKLWELGEKLGFQTHVRWGNDGSDGNIEVVFIPMKYKGYIPEMPANIVIKPEKDYFMDRKDSVDIIETPEHQIQIWKNALKELLPNYMVPSLYVTLSHLPTTNNGKIDRKNLPIPDRNISQSIGSTFIAPRNETEKLISSIWTELLSLESISIHSNFFELGGHSLTAVHVMLSLEKETGVRLPISTLFENSTIEKLAKLISGEKKVSKWHSLVPIKTTGSKTPIYLVHGGGFNVLTFEPFSKYMDPEQPIYALQGLGLQDKTVLLSTIEDIAKFYISEVLENDPIGPYALGGYCSGGIIAYEMSRQLLALGKKVSLLAMFDTHNNNFTNTVSTKNGVRKTLFYTKTVLKHPRKTLSHFKSKMYRDLPMFQQDNEISSYGSEVNERYLNAFENYKAQPIDIRINLFKAQERVFFLTDPVYYGWKDFALKGVDVHIMRGNHSTFITSPNEKYFATVLQKVIDDNTNL